MLAVLVDGRPAAGQTAPPTFQALAKQADAARDSKQLEKAVTLYRQALKLKPDWDEGLWNLGSMSVTVKNCKEADEAHRGGNRRFDVKCNDCTKHHNRQGYADLNKGNPMPAMPSAPPTVMMTTNVMGTSQSARSPSCHAKTPTITMARM